jgi:hypothetical protein
MGEHPDKSQVASVSAEPSSASELIARWDAYRRSSGDDDDVVGLMRLLDDPLLLVRNRASRADWSGLLLEVGRLLGESGRFKEAFLALTLLDVRFEGSTDALVQCHIVESFQLLAFHSWAEDDHRSALKALSEGISRYRKSSYLEVRARVAALLYVKALILQETVGNSPTNKRGIRHTLAAFDECLRYSRDKAGERVCAARAVRDKGVMLAGFAFAR